MGKSQRFQLRADIMPGPGNYKISGFADSVLKKASKMKIREQNVSQPLSIKEDSKASFGDRKSCEVGAMMDLLDNDHSRIENSDEEENNKMVRSNSMEQEL